MTACHPRTCASPQSYNYEHLYLSTNQVTPYTPSHQLTRAPRFLAYSRICFSKPSGSLETHEGCCSSPFVSVRLPAINPARHAVNLSSSAEHTQVATRGEHRSVAVLPVQSFCHGSSRRHKGGEHKGGEECGEFCLGYICVAISGDHSK